MVKLRDALELVKSGEHVGKVILVNYEQGQDGACHPLPVKALDMLPPRSLGQGTVLVTGGTGGFGHTLVDSLFTQGEKHFIIPTRCADMKDLRAKFKYIIESPGASMEFVVADIGNEEGLERLMAVARAASPPLKKVYHVAGISRDVTLPDLTMKDFHAVADCKAMAALRLSEMTQDMDLDDFVVISSVASLVGGKGMGAYSAANAFLDGLMRYRRSMGLPGTTFNMA